MADAAPQQLPPGVMQQAGDPLAQLRDIHVPGPIDTWPPAPGWWLLAGLVLIGLISLSIWLYRRWRANRYRREALAELAELEATWRETGDAHAYLAALQHLLKRVALTTFKREEVASLTGEAWVAFLDRSTGSHDFSMAESEALIDGNYRSDASIDVAALQAVAQTWIRKHDKRYLLLSQEQEAEAA